MTKKTGFVVACLVAAGAMALTAVGCKTDGFGIPILPREGPAIITTTPAQPTLQRRFVVDLRNYLEASTLAWEFGDGSVALNLSRAAGTEVTHTYANAGTFTVKVHVFGGKNPLNQYAPLLGSGELPVNVIGPNQNPTAQFVSTTPTGGAARELQFDGSSSSDPDGQIVKFAWDFGDGATSTEGGIVRHTFAAPGRYAVKLTVTDNRDGTASTTQTVVANVPPVAAYTSVNAVDGTGAARPQVFDFDASTSSDADGQIVSYKWSFGDNSAEDSGQTVQHTFPNPGEFSVTLTVTDNLGGTDVETRTIDATGTDPFISEVSPEVGEVGGNVTVQLTGFNLTANPTVRLTSATLPDITATSVNFVNDRRVDATFNLAGAGTGLRSIVLTDTAARTTTKADAFTVVTPNRVRMVTSLGDIVLEMDRTAAPNTVTNFYQYIADGFYDNTVFHRVVNTPNPFVIQGGGFESLGQGADPRLKEKTPRAAINSEANNGLSNLRGTIAMALRGQNANSATSQFFINLADNTSLDNGPPPFTVFGKVVEGLTVVDAIAAVQVGTFNVTANNTSGGTITTEFENVPVTDVTVIRVVRE